MRIYGYFWWVSSPAIHFASAFPKPFHKKRRSSARSGTGAAAPAAVATTMPTKSSPIPVAPVIPAPLSPSRRPRSRSRDVREAGSVAEVVDQTMSPAARDKRVKVAHPEPRQTDAGVGAKQAVAEEAAPEPERPVTARKVEDKSAEYRMPAEYTDCQALKLGACIAEMLVELIRINDQFPPRDGQLTRFHSRAPPDITVNSYLSRLIVHATLTPPILLCMVYYIDRLCSLYPAFTINSLTVHRYLITSATVACKGLSDSFWTNNTYARVGGISSRELASLEMELLSKLEWRIVPRPEVLVDYYRSLIGNSKVYWLDRGTPHNAEADVAQ